MMYEFFAKTDRGLARGNNEDSVVLDAACGLVVLADGMGGYNAGEVASGMATDSIRSELGRWLSGPGTRASARAAARASRAASASWAEALSGMAFMMLRG